METLEVELLHAALKDEKIQLKYFDVSDYLKVIELMKQLNSHIESISLAVNKLIEDYNKEYSEKRKSKEFEVIISKKKDNKELSSEEQLLLEIQPVIKVLSNGIVSGPIEAITKIEKIRDQKLPIKKETLNFVKDGKALKLVVENTSPDKQLILFQNLYKK